MPELPEVETVMRGLAGRLQGRRLARVVLARPDLRWAVPEGFVQHVTGASVIGFRRRGKYIFMRLDRGVSVLIHLGMSGRMTIDRPQEAHQHLTIETEDGTVIGFVDPRRFGALDLVPTGDEDTHWLVKGLGPEPLGDEFTAAYLDAALAGRSSPIKTVLLDQSVVAGIGNIYASEALFRSRISPRRRACNLGRARIARLVPAIRETLEAAIAAGGSSLRDYVQPSGEFGYFQHAWKVYDRAGLPCERCPGPPSCHGIVRFVQSNRATYACPMTQR